MSVKKDVIKASNGRQVEAGNTITVHCTGSLTNPPKKFWRSVISRILFTLGYFCLTFSTKDPGQKPFTFQVGVGKVIKGTLNLRFIEFILDLKFLHNYKSSQGY